MTIEVGSRVYITAWALGNGICVGTLKKVSQATGNLYIAFGEHSLASFFAPKDVHMTLESAQVRVREMVAAKLKSLDKQRAKLEKLAKDGAKVKE